MKVIEAIADTLDRYGVRIVFGLLGGGNMYVVDEMVERNQVRLVNATREDAAIMMAEAYAKVTGQLGVASVTYGPGLTNSVTAITEAARAQTPLLIITGHRPQSAKSDGPQEIQAFDHESLVSTTGAGYHIARSATTAVADLVQAVERTFHERRPVVFGLPTDVQFEEVDHSPLDDGPIPLTYLSVPPQPRDVGAAVDVILANHSPLILAGRGAVHSDAKEAILDLANRLGAPIATTLMAREYFAGDPAYIGGFGAMSTPAVREVINRSDCIVTFGASLNWFTNHGGTLVNDKAIVQCDIELTRIGRNTPVAVGVVGDARRTALAICEELEQREHRPEFRFLDSALSTISGAQVAEVDDMSTDTTVDIRTFMIRMNESLPTPRTVVTDAGRFVMAPIRYLNAGSPRDFVVPMTFAAVGLGLGSAIGAAFAKPNQPTVLVTGDGGFMMSLSEINTAVQHNLNLIVLIMNDGAYGAEYDRYKLAGMNPTHALQAWPDFAPVAEAFGATGITVRRLDDIERVLDVVASSTTPVIVDVKLDPAVSVLKWRVS